MDEVCEGVGTLCAPVVMVTLLSLGLSLSSSLS